ncbi:MAG: LuxR C-terminal-related transcriptional regulator [Cyanobium sp.]
MTISFSSPAASNAAFFWPKAGGKTSIFRGALKGFSDVQIADAMQISVHTVKDYGKSIRGKYNVKTRLQLVSALLGRATQKVR